MKTKQTKNGNGNENGLTSKNNTENITNQANPVRKRTKGRPENI